MAWPYEFLDLTKDEKHARRLALDRYASLAQLLVFAPTFIALLARLCVWAVARAKTSKGDYNAIPASPSLKLKRTSIRGGWAATARKFKWWLQDDIVFRSQNWGQRDQWIFGILWAAVLLVLCVVGTGRDYLHLTKRFGIIAASQMPLQYLLALKFLNPFAFVLRSSHEQVNRWHRVLGRIIYGLLCLHAIFYLNYFYHHSITKKRLIAPIVAAGVAGFIGLTLLSSTSLSFIRRYSYRVFFITHLVVAVLMPPMIILHARPSNLYMAEALIVFVFDLAARKTSTIASDATVESIPGTNLVKISAAIPYNRINSFREHPGSHIYLSIPAAARPSSNPASINYLLFEFLFNPFTVAAVDETTGDLTLVARHRTGPLTAALARFAHGSSGGNASAQIEKTKMPLAIEGPYGAVTHFPILSGGHFDRVLLVAGGIGATFTVPIYRALRQDSPQTKVDLVWAVRSAGDATWALAGQEDGRAILNDKSIHIYLTGDIVDAVPAAPASTGGSSSVPGDGDAVEMNTLQHDHRRNRLTANANNRRRPDLKKIIEDTFKHGLEERVAILVCGPEAMGRELRQYVGPWVMKGRSIWWHNESFDW